MTNYSIKNIDEFIAAAPEESRPHLKELAALIESAVPGAEGGIHYGKPYYKYRGYLAGFDVYKKHIGFEIWNSQLPTDDRQALEKKGYTSGSRTFQIRYDQDVPTAIIKKMLKNQAKSNELKSNK